MIFINIATRLELWCKQYRSILLYALETTKIKAGQLQKIEAFQCKMLKGMIGLSRQASGQKTRLLAGITTANHEIWKARYGALNNVLIGDTIARQYVVLAWSCRIEKTWTLSTVRKLETTLKQEGIANKISSADILLNNRNQFKEDIKNVMIGAEVQRCVREIQTETRRIPHSPFKTVMPLNSKG